MKFWTALWSSLAICVSSLSPAHAAQRSLAGLTIIVTGASSGIGRGIAVRLGQEHANVVLAARRPEVLQAVAREIRAAGGRALVVPTDVGSAEQVAHLARAARQRFGRVDVWINNVGVGAITRFWDAPVADYSKIVDTNLKGVIYGSSTAIRQFRAQGGGTLINVGSVESELPLAYHAVYASTKAAMLSLGRSLREELRLDGQRNISLSTVMPFATDTPWIEHAANYSGHTGQMAFIDPTSKVVDATLGAIRHPREEVIVGWKGKSTYWLHRLVPDVAEHLAANAQHRGVVAAPPTPKTAGAVHRPIAAGTGEDGGVRVRIAQESEQRKQAKAAARR